MSNVTTTLFQQYLQVTSTNNLFNDYKDRWQFYLESYMGGSEYRNAGHLMRYQMETNKEYGARLASTPLDNHCKSVISVYTSFLFRQNPKRELDVLRSIDPMLEDFLYDADREGRSLDAFMKEVSIWANVFGHCYVLVSKPNLGAVTRADEIEMGVRPYVSLITPLTVMEWNWSRNSLGAYELDYLKYKEDVNGDVSVIKKWTRETITTYIVDDAQKQINEEIVEVNGLGMIPVVQVYASRSPVRGIGQSAISDIADQQKAIYNELSEIEQLIRLQNHPALVKTPDVEAGAGAGAIIQMPENLDAGLKPYLLEPSGNGLSSIYASIAARINSIDKMANIGAIRTNESREISGVAMRTEFELLNAKLSELADNLELAEEHIWKFYSAYLGTYWDGEIEYPGSFNIQDEESEIAKLKMARDTATDPRVFELIDYKLVALLGEDPSIMLPNLVSEGTQALPEAPAFQPHVMYDPVTGDEKIARTEDEHIALMNQGYIHKENHNE
jgi:hypothetical protein